MIIKEIFKGKNRIYNDFFLSISASMILTFSLQLVVLPFISSQINSASFGQVLTIIGLINLFAVSTGNTLNNTRLLSQKDYEGASSKGDFNIIVIFLMIITSCFLFVILLLSNLVSIRGVFFALAINVMLISRSYFSVSFRLNLNFKGILISNALVSIGYIFGLLVFQITKNWYFIFLFGEIFANLFILHGNPLLKEGFIVGQLAYKTFRKFSFLLVSTFIFTSITYMDRFIIFPFLGPESVAIFSVSSFLGKTVGLVMGPISGVLLSYYVKEKSITLKIFLKRLMLFSIFSLFVFLSILIFGDFVLNILYPNIAPLTSDYFVLANFALIILILGNTLSPLLLRFCHLRWQPITQAVYVVLYVILGYFSMVNFGLLGFCYALVIVNSFRLFMLIVIVILSIRSNQLKEATV